MRGDIGMVLRSGGALEGGMAFINQAARITEKPYGQNLLIFHNYLRYLNDTEAAHSCQTLFCRLFFLQRFAMQGEQFFPGPHALCAIK